MNRKYRQLQLIPEQPSPIEEFSEFKLIQGNAIAELEKLPPQIADLIFVDPPYFLSNGGTTCRSGKRSSVNKGYWDKSQGYNQDLEFHRSWLDAVKRALKPNGTVWVCGTYHNIYLGSLLQQDFHILNEIVWLKPNAPPNLGCRQFTASHETLIWAKKSPKARHTFNYKDSRKWDDGDWIKRPDTQMRSVWSIPAPGKSEKNYGKHPTQKPLKLLKRIIALTSKPGDLILDPMMGSGTTGVAAALLNRKFFGIELNPEYFDLAKARLLSTFE